MKKIAMCLFDSNRRGSRCVVPIVDKDEGSGNIPDKGDPETLYPVQ